MSLLNVGDKISDFTLMDQDGNAHQLNELCSGLTLLYFYPKAMTPGCTTQACSLRDNYELINQLKIKVIGISCDSPERLKKFQEKENLNFMLLSDPEHKLCEYFGVWALKKMAGREYMGILRTSFIVKENTVVAVFPKVKPKEHLNQVVNWLKENQN